MAHPADVARFRGGFDFCAAMRVLCAELIRRTPELAHIDLARVAIASTQTRKRVRHGLQATLTPLRFADGRLVGELRGRRYRVERLLDPAGREMLYILRFYLPRFMDLPFAEKLQTVVHELWHIGPEFNGDLRRFDGRCYAHTHSQKRYDAQMLRIAERYLAAGPPESAHAFLRLSFGELRQRYGRVYGVRVRQPKLIPDA